MQDKVIKARPGLDAAVPVPLGAPRVVKRDVFQASVEAREIIEAAERQAQTLIDEAVRRRDEELQMAREQAFQQGLAEWDRARLDILDARAALDAKYEGELVRLSVKIAEKIIGEELRTRPETIASIVRECLRGIRNQHSLTVRVNSSEREEVLRQLPSLERESGSSDIHISADPAVPSGGCIVESERGIVDARLETQLKRLEDVLRRISRGSSEP